MRARSRVSEGEPEAEASSGSELSSGIVATDPGHQGPRVIGARPGRAGRFGKGLFKLDAIVLSDVTLTRLQQLVMQRLFKTDEDGNDLELTVDELRDLGRIVDSAIGSRKQVEQMRREFDESRRQAAAEATQAAGAGFDGKAVAERVCALLGIPPGDDPDI